MKTKPNSRPRRNRARTLAREPGRKEQLVHSVRLGTFRPHRIGDDRNPGGPQLHPRRTGTLVAAGMSSIAIPTPCAGDDLLFVSSGYVGDKFRPLYAPCGRVPQGDISLKPGETNNAFVAWSDPTGGPYNPRCTMREGFTCCSTADF